MRIHGIMLVKDEVDVIGETLEAAVAWCDAIYVFDNGSRDGTWEQVQAFARRSDRVIPYRQAGTPFSQSLRGEVFRYYRDRARPGDWWCILDGDEFYVDDPRVFLSAVPSRFGEVWSASYQYYFTDDDLRRYEVAPEAFLSTPVTERLRYYLNNWSESRFMRHHTGLVWPRDRDGHPGYRRPLGLGATFPRRIRLKHYQYRSPEQMQRRLDSRMAITTSYRHEHQPDWLAHLLGREVPPEVLAEVVGGAPSGRPGAPSWRDRLVPAAYLHYDAGDGQLEPDEAALPPIPTDRYGVRRAKHQARATYWRVREAIARPAR
ncbi:MAG: glycosyltransferase family 2 protein [Dehalococcoidia bacterium]|nr:glycosyltransferase family 2 protein [Dehalococcoidia bacterium]